jgi:hypothetical protein
MAYIKKFDGKTDLVIALGNKDKTTDNPTSIEGYFMGTKETPDTGYGPGKLHFFQTEKGVVGVWGKTNSNRLLTQDHRGQMCLLTFTGMGERKKGKNPAYEYSLQYDPNNTIDVSGVDLSASEPETDDDLADENTGTATPDSKFAPTQFAGPSASSSSRQAEIQAMLKARK